MSGEPPTEGVQAPRSKEHLEALQHFHSALEKLHTAEAELARVRVDALSRGLDINVADELHW